MILTVKTLKGGKFTIEVDPSNTVAQVKTVIVSCSHGFLGGTESVALVGHALPQVHRLLVVGRGSGSNDFLTYATRL